MADLTNDEEIELYLAIETVLADARALKLGLAEDVTDAVVAWINAHGETTPADEPELVDPGPYVSTYPFGNKIADEDAEAAWNKRRKAILARLGES